MNKSTLYSLLNGMLDDVDLHLKTAFCYANEEDAEKAVIRCEKAISSLEDAEEEIESKEKEISHQKMVHFRNQIIKYRQKIWQATHEINLLAKTNFTLYKKSKNLRLNLLVYSYDPTEGHHETSQIS